MDSQTRSAPLEPSSLSSVPPDAPSPLWAQRRDLPAAQSWSDGLAEEASSACSPAVAFVMARAVVAQGHSLLAQAWNGPQGLSDAIRADYLPTVLLAFDTALLALLNHRAERSGEPTDPTPSRAVAAAALCGEVWAALLNRPKQEQGLCVSLLTLEACQIDAQHRLFHPRSFVFSGPRFGVCDEALKVLLFGLGALAWDLERGEASRS